MRINPKLVYNGGTLSKRVLWVMGLVFALALTVIAVVLAGKGQHKDAEPEDVAATTGGQAGNAGLDDILSRAPTTPGIKAPPPPSVPASAGSGRTSPASAGAPPGDGGANDGRPAGVTEVDRDQLRITQLKQQQLEVALMSGSKVNADLDALSGDATSKPAALARPAIGPAAAASQDDPNKQGDKIAFSEGVHSNTYLTKGREMPVSALELKVGTIIPATLISGINSDLPGQVIASVSQNVYDSATHSTILLPQGAKLYGVYDSRVAFGQDRLLMAWTRVNYPDGTTLELDGMGGADSQGFAGFSDQVDNHYWKVFGNAALLGMISGATQAGVSNGNSGDTSTSEAVSNGVTQQFAETGSSLIQKNLDVQPTIKIRNGYKFNVMLNKDVILPPYEGGQ